MRNLILILFLFSFSTDMLGQKSKTIRLKDGSQLRGKILSESKDSLLIRLSVGDTIAISSNSLFAPKRTSKKKYVDFDGHLILKKGMYTHMYSSLLLGSTVSNSGFRRARRGFTPFGLTVGYTFNERWSFGGGISIDFLQDAYFPLYIESRMNFAVKKVTPYAAVKLGYAGGNLSNNFRTNNIGGPLINPLLGLQFASESRNNFTIELGFRYQRDVSETETSRRIRQIYRYTIGLGLMM